MTIKVFLAEVITDVPNKLLMHQRMEELQQLVSTYGGLTVTEIIQQRAVPDYTYYIGSGKLEEIRQLMLQTGAKILIVGNILKPRQIYNITEYLRKDGLQAWDRVDLILNIFDRHAISMEARLQVELAAIQHMGPRIFGMGMELSRQGGGSTTARGLGETNTERMRRHLATKKDQIIKKLKQYEQVRATHRQARKRNKTPTVGLVGYTNAGKSSLMHALTNKDVLIENKLFATLGTNVGQLRLPTDEQTGEGRIILVNDTIGFIRDLPPSLIKAFRSTLEDSIEADLLLHVVDSCDLLIQDKIQVVEDILRSIGATQESRLVFNKIDLLTKTQKKEVQQAFPNVFFVSAETGEGINDLELLLTKHFL